MNLTAAVLGALYCFKPIPSMPDKDVALDYVSNPPIMHKRGGVEEQLDELKDLGDGRYDDSTGILFLRDGNLILESYEGKEVGSASPVESVEACLK